jgi:hypothetical protein
MIHLTNFDVDFYGRTFTDRSLGIQTDMTCVGYGDNQGNPYIVGMYVDQQTKSVNLKTALIKNAEFKPK